MLLLSPALAACDFANGLRVNSEVCCQIDSISRVPSGALDEKLSDEASVFNGQLGLTSIARLNSRRGPTDISRPVVTVVVDAIKAVCLRWSRSNLGNNVCFKGSIGTSPAVAHRDAATTVIVKGAILRVKAALLDIGPLIVEGMRQIPCTISHWRAYLTSVVLRVGWCYRAIRPNCLYSTEAI